MYVTNSTKYVITAGNQVDVLIPDITSLLISTGAATTAELKITLEQHPIGNLTTAPAPEIIFTDVGSADTITRNNGSWIADRFQAGQNITITNSVSNDGTYIIASVSEKTIVLTAAAVLTDETVAAGSNIVISSIIQDIDFKLYQNIAADTEYWNVFEFAPNAIRVIATGGTVTLWVKG